MHPYRRAARAAGLVYCCDEGRGLERRGRIGAFHYIGPSGRRIHDRVTIRRIRRLVIPPAWTQVWINPHPRGHLQASGRDGRGRKQYLYHPDWRTVRDAAKFDQVVAFANALPELRRAVRSSLRRPRLDLERVTAVVVRLLETSLIRVGNEEYARTNNSYGLTTLRARHARISRGRIRFTFRGKSGLRHEIEVRSPNLARIVRRLQELPGQELFCYRDAGGNLRRVRSDDVNAYLRERTGAEFTAKDFRTWAGTVLAAMTLAQLPTPATRTENRRSLAAAVKTVAARLGNTPAIARKSYIHPAVLEGFTTGRLPRLPSPETWPPPRPPRGLAPAERAVLRLLRTAQPAGARVNGSAVALLPRRASRRRN